MFRGPCATTCIGYPMCFLLDLDLNDFKTLNEGDLGGLGGFGLLLVGKEGFVHEGCRVEAKI